MLSNTLFTWYKFITSSSQAFLRIQMTSHDNANVALKSPPTRIAKQDTRKYSPNHRLRLQRETPFHRIYIGRESQQISLHLPLQLPYSLANKKTDAQDPYGSLGLINKEKGAGPRVSPKEKTLCLHPLVRLQPGVKSAPIVCLIFYPVVNLCRSTLWYAMKK